MKSNSKFIHASSDYPAGSQPPSSSRDHDTRRLPRDAPKSIYLTSEKESVEIKLPRVRLCKPVKIPNKSGVVWLSKEPLPENKKDIPKGTPKIKINPSWSRVLLVFVEDPSNSALGMKPFVVNTAAEDFPPGGLYFFNFSTAKVEGTLGNKKLSLMPKSTGRIKAPVKEDGDYPVRINCLMPGKKPRSMMRGVWRREPHARQLVFIVPSPKSKVPRILSIPDFNPPQQKNKCPHWR